MALERSEISMIISGYIRENGGTLNTMSNIYQQLTGVNNNFTRWDQAEDSFLTLKWDAEQSRRFLEYARSSIEAGQDIISQSYLDIIAPDEINTETITDVLDGQPATDDEKGRTGFSYTVRDNGIIDAEYYYYTTDVHVTSNLDLDEIPDQKHIPLQFIPPKRLVIVRNTQPAKVVKINSILSKKTGLETSPTGNIKLLPLGEAREVSRNFVESFESSAALTDGGATPTEPTVDEVTEVDMYNPNMDKSDPVQKADLAGEYHIFDSDEINDLRKDGWYERGVGIKMSYKGRIYNIKVAGKDRMGYLKISDIKDIDRGRELVSKIRAKYLEHYRVLPQTKGIY